MVQFTIERSIEAPRQVVWDTLADFGNIATWNSGVRSSRLTSEHGQGVDATRHCEFPNGMSVDERILSWDDLESFRVGFDRIPAPIRDVSATFRLEGDGPTRLVVDYAYKGKGWMAPMAPLMKPMFRKAMKGLAADLQAHCEGQND